jgi:hypothetical protein
MNLSAHLAKHFRDVHFGGNWTAVNLKDTLSGLSWEQATAKINSFNTIAALTFHMNYFVSAVLKVLQGGPLEAHDKFSFDLPEIKCQEDWELLLGRVWSDAENFALRIEQLPDTKLREVFTDERYGTYYSNIQGIIEHCHYHLGQIVILKKLVEQP